MHAALTHTVRQVYCVPHLDASCRGLCVAVREHFYAHKRDAIVILHWTCLHSAAITIGFWPFYCWIFIAVTNIANIWWCHAHCHTYMLHTRTCNKYGHKAGYWFDFIYFVCDFCFFISIFLLFCVVTLESLSEHKHWQVFWSIVKIMTNFLSKLFLIWSCRLWGTV